VSFPEISSISWAHMKTETESSLRNVLFSIKDRTMDNIQNCGSYSLLKMLSQIIDFVLFNKAFSGAYDECNYYLTVSNDSCSHLTYMILYFSIMLHWFVQNKNSFARLRERTIPTERPPLVGDVCSNFCGYRVPRGERNGSLRPYSRFSRSEPLIFLPSNSSIILTRLNGPRCRPTTCQKIWQRRESNPNLWSLARNSDH
jgi:hypothetical protein